MLAFYNSFLKIELNCDKENHANFKYMQFSKGARVRVFFYQIFFSPNDDSPSKTMKNVFDII